MLIILTKLNEHHTEATALDCYQEQETHACKR